SDAAAVAGGARHRANGVRRRASPARKRVRADEVVARTCAAPAQVLRGRRDAAARAAACARRRRRRTCVVASPAGRTRPGGGAPGTSPWSHTMTEAFDRRLRSALFALFLGLSSPWASAHGDEPHGDEPHPVAASASATPGFEAASDAFELVA